MKLNGWQRLWVVTSIIIFVIAVSYTIVLLPGKSEIMSRWVYETIEAVRNTKGFEEHSSDSVIDLFELRLRAVLSGDRYALRDYSDKQLIDKIHQKYVDKNPLTKIKFDEIDRRYRNELDSLPIKRAKHALIVLVIYLCLISALYGIGWSIGWIYRGFRTKESPL